MKFLPELCSELDSVQTIRKIVVGKYEVGPDHPSCHQIQRRDAIARCCRAMTFALKESLKQLANLGIVINYKDLASAVNRCDGPVIQTTPDGVPAAVPFYQAGA